MWLGLFHSLSVPMVTISKRGEPRILTKIRGTEGTIHLNQLNHFLDSFRGLLNFNYFSILKRSFNGRNRSAGTKKLNFYGFKFRHMMCCLQGYKNSNMLQINSYSWPKRFCRF